MPEDQIATALAARGAHDSHVRVWRTAWPSLMLWLQVQGALRPMVIGSRLWWPGLDYPAVDVVMRRRRIDDPEGRLFEDLQVMEAAALDILNRA